MYKHLQSSRALAALLVVAFHLGGTLAKEKYLGASAAGLERLFSFGHCGVAFFFVLSGFIITLVHRRDWDHPERLPAFLKKRLIRIYPAYLIVFLGVYLLGRAMPSSADTMPRDFLTLLKCVTLFPQDGTVVGGTGAPVLVVAWTLQYEMAFYLAFGLAILKRQLLVGLVALFLINFGITRFYPPAGFLHAFFSSPMIFLFLFGVLAALVAKSKMVIKRPVLLAWLGGVAFAGVAASEVVFRGQLPDLNLFYGLASALLIVGLVRAEDDRGVARQPKSEDKLMLLGDASYALYLIHFPLISIFCKGAVKAGLHGTGGAVIAFVLGVAICTAAAVGFHLWIERPLLKMLSGSRRAPLLTGKTAGAR